MSAIPIEARLCKAALSAAARERTEGKLHKLGRTTHRTLAPAAGRPSVIMQREVSDTLTILTRELEPRSFPECARAPALVRSITPQQPEEEYKRCAPPATPPLPPPLPPQPPPLPPPPITKY